jgi:cytochrome c553
MKIIISALSALLLLGCSSQENEHKTVQKSAPVAQEVTVEKKVEKLEQKVKEELKEVAAPTLPEPVAVAPKLHKQEGAELFQKCVSCHGSKAEKSALNKSQIIAGWDAEKITAALKGYQDGSYGGAMKGLMNAQVKTLSDEDIAALATYISKQ